MLCCARSSGASRLEGRAFDSAVETLVHELAKLALFPGVPEVRVHRVERATGQMHVAPVVERQPDGVAELRHGNRMASRALVATVPGFDRVGHVRLVIFAVLPLPVPAGREVNQELYVRLAAVSHRRACRSRAPEARPADDLRALGAGRFLVSGDDLEALRKRPNGAQRLGPRPVVEVAVSRLDPIAVLVNGGEPVGALVGAEAARGAGVAKRSVGRA